MKTKTTVHTDSNIVCYNHEQFGFHKLIGITDAYSIHVLFPGNTENLAI